MEATENLQTSQPTQPVQSVPVEPKKKSNTLLVVILLIVILLIPVGVYAGMQISKKQEPVVVIPTAPPQEIRPTEVLPTLVSDEAVYTEQGRSANWKTYTNTKYGFSFKYPLHFLKKEDQYLVEVFSPPCSCDTDAYGSADIKISASEVRVSTSFHEGKSYNDIWERTFGFDFSEKNYDGTSFIGGKKAYYFSQGAEDPFGRQAYLVEISPTTALEINVYTPILIYRCSECFAKNNPSRATNDQILSTFKFTSGQNQVSNKINITLPVTVLNTDFGITGVTLPPYPKTVTITIPAQYSDKVAVYGVSGYTILAPKGWTGKGLIGASGSDGFDLYPIENNETGSKISVEIESTGTGPALYNAAPFFSWARTHFPVGIPTPTPIPGLTVNVITSHLVAYSYPAVSSDIEVNGIAFSDAQDHEKDQFWSFEKMEVVLPKTQHDLSTILLNNYIQQRSLDKK